MQLECELCGAHYKADIADAHVVGGRLAFTCHSCGREVVVVGGSSDRTRRAGVLLPDQSDEEIPVLSDLIVGAPAAADSPDPAAGSAGGVFPEEIVPETALPPGPAVVELPPKADAGSAAPERLPEPVFTVEEKKGFNPLLLGIGLVAVLAVVFVVFIRPMLSGGSDGGPGEKTKRAAVPAPPPAWVTPAAPGTAAPELTAPVASPTPETAPMVQIRELMPPEAKPTAVPTPRKETVRDAATVLETGAIEEALIRARPLYRLCAVTEIKRDPDAKLGTVVASLTIAPSGTVSKVSLDRADLASSPLGQCVREALAKSTFPPFEGAPVVLKQMIGLDVPAGR